MPLFRQHLRRIPWVYSFGIACFAVWAAAFLFFYFVTVGRYDVDIAAWWICSICTAGIVSFWATIFKGEKTGRPPQFRRRLLIPTLLYLPVLITTLLYLYNASNETNKIRTLLPPLFPPWNEFLYDDLPLTCVCWFAPLALGTFISLCVKKTIWAIVLTVFGCALLFLWAWFPMIMVGCSPWWTSIPICFALLLGARIKFCSAADEQAAHRYRWMPLVPIIGTILAVLLAFPFVRLFSIPNVSWQEIAECLEKTQFKPRLSPEKRRAMLESLEKHHAFPADFRLDERQSLSFNPPHGCRSPSGNVVETLRLRLQAHKEYFADPITLEEEIFSQYPQAHISVKYAAHGAGSFIHPMILYSPLDVCYASMIQILPWERERLNRILRLSILSALVEPKDDQPDRLQLLKRWFEKHRYRKYRTLERFFWEDSRAYRSWNIWDCLDLLFSAVNCYRAEHGEAPKTLDDLLGNYLDVLPVDPGTGALPELLFDEPKPAPRDSKYYCRAIYWGDDPFGYDSGVRIGDLPDDFRGTVLRLGNKAYGILDPLEEEKQ